MAELFNIAVPEASELEVAKISNFKVAASYNWMDEMTPVILVPGLSSLKYLMNVDLSNYKVVLSSGVLRLLHPP